MDVSQPTLDTRSSKKQTPKWQQVLSIIMVLLLLAGLPIAVWLDLSTLSDTMLLRQVKEFNGMITSIRGYYTKNVVMRIQAAPGKETKIIDNYRDVPGAIPIPATLSIELSGVVSEKQNNIAYRFISDYPFKKRKEHAFDSFERSALAELRNRPNQQIAAFHKTGLDNSVTLISPVIMTAACVSCHNSHPDSIKHDWNLGDVRGIQEVTINSPIAMNILSFKYLLSYFVLAAVIGITFITIQRRQARMLNDLNLELGVANDFLASVSTKISRYLSPQIYKSIFIGQNDATIHTERHKLTIFFSDIKDFTSITEQLQPEEMTLLLNEYFTEMANIALKHGGTIDKFIGDAMLIFFGNPETKGVAEDAKTCLRMAVEMQERLDFLQSKWRKEGIEHPFEVRMGINTGYCNVGNFGSDMRMDYTIIGAEANLAARLQSAADPGAIVMSYESFMLVQDIAVGHAIPPIKMKGISREIKPYVFDAFITK